MSKSTFHFAENSNCEQEKDNFSNICAEGLLENIPIEDLGAVVLTADTMSSMSSGLGPDDDASEAEGVDLDLDENHSLDEEDEDLDDELDECVIEGTTGHSLHHRSKNMRALADSLVTKNGIISMACLLASKW